MTRSTEIKKANYMCSKPERFRDVSTNDIAVVERGLKEALVRNGIAAECYEASSDETVVFHNVNNLCLHLHLPLKKKKCKS